ncbi:peptidoglycan/xylan/chitin deacetylase (PgdA/CDA1 family) [Micromonospora vinacea]|uniref:Peptidoglycan/xylan/chitin deacetylase (PgdA/CDA1 family) n=1 Tax=Micromonospora vinacea TaxID=709878 RepID=A0ABS0JX48_9ACTN|nr:polysaccharide deacetylase family protein [Micromonospora vinacea]MBG6100946.1 peptidoglycan/xylan/chitin deacetylase (PgdA/CDA1 family) [Micromonospora vinacea]WTA67359.1 polysaccharide deacetylase family protein [Micromonospora sp. NBC_00855]
MTRGSSTARAAGIVTLVVAGLLGSAYVLGRSLVSDQPPPHSTGATTSADGPHYADQPSTGEPGAAPSSSAGPAEAGQDGSGRDAGGDNLFGAHSTTGTPRLALTFDDGPDPRYTPQVLALLSEYDVRATFCVVGENAQNHPELVQSIVDAGHTLCNHSWHHDVGLGARSADAIRSDLLRTNAAIRAAVPNAPIVWYRQPGGAWTYPVVSVAQQLGMTPLHWSVDPSDWELPGASKITATVLSQAEPGSVVLLHDAGGDRQGTVEALRRILPDLTARFELEALPTDPT